MGDERELANMGILKGKKALVTGVEQGPGYASAQYLVEGGADFAVHYFSGQAGANELKSLGEKKGRSVFLFQADLAQESKARALPGLAAEASRGGRPYQERG
jgi:3-oxoacyl-[acyl-carrier protein] reductase